MKFFVQLSRKKVAKQERSKEALPEDKIVLNFDKKNNIGINFVMDMLHLSPLGRRRHRMLTPFMAGEEDKFRAEMDNLSRLTTSVTKSRAIWNKIRVRLNGVKDIVPTLNKLSRSIIMSETEFYEIKCFAMEANVLMPLITAASEDIGLTGVKFTALDDVVKLLDPLGTGSAAFEISSVYSDVLRSAREEKRVWDMKLRSDPDNSQYKEMRMRVVTIEREEESRVLGDLSGKVMQFANDMIADSLMLGYFDLLLEKAFLSSDRNLSRPVLSDRINFIGAVNPKIEDALKRDGKTFTPVDIILEQGTTVISGANMSGKSVALKTLILNLYLVSVGFFPFAEYCEVFLFDDILTISEDLEDGNRGLSSFGGEIVRLNECIAETDERFVLLFMDEFARGTNPVEGAKIARAASEFFNNRDCVCVMTTHFDGVSDVACAHYQVRGLTGIRPSGFSGENIASLMDYSLEKVPLDQPVSREAIKVCRLLDMCPELLALVEAEEEDE